MSKQHNAFLASLGFGMLLVTCFKIYSFGFPGAFMFDDLPNLEPLGYWGAVDSFDHLLNYLGSGFSGPTGRPVALASFLIDANTWPADPYSFKRTNVLFHLLTGCGVLLFLIRFVVLIKPEATQSDRIMLACVCVAALWLLHPYWVSTSLYVIQRMAILSALFGIFSLWCYLAARCEVVRAGCFNAKAVLWIALAGILFVSGVYSKENIVILPISALVLEATLHSQTPVKCALWRWLVVVGCVLPSVALLGYLIQRGINGWEVIDSRRGFSVGDRFLAQGRILWEYLYQIIVPQPYTGGLYTQFNAPLDGTGRLLGVIGWFAFAILMIVTWLLRGRWPLLFPGITLYVVGHLIESTVIPLELYFEHRNYFPGIFLALIPLQIAFSDKISRVLIWVFSLTALLVLAVLLWMRASLWADYPSLVESWADHSPQSVRAQLETSKLALQFGDGAKALSYYSNAQEVAPDDLRTGLWGVFIGCALAGEISVNYADELGNRLSSAPDSGSILQYMTVLVEQIPDMECDGASNEQMDEWLRAYLSSPRTGKKTGHRINMLLGVNAVLGNDPGQALVHFREGIWGARSVNAGMLAISRLASGGYTDEANTLLEEVRGAYIEGRLAGNDVDYDLEMDRIRETLERD